MNARAVRRGRSMWLLGFATAWIVHASTAGYYPLWICIPMQIMVAAMAVRVDSQARKEPT